MRQKTMKRGRGTFGVSPSEMRVVRLVSPLPDPVLVFPAMILTLSRSRAACTDTKLHFDAGQNITLLRCRDQKNVPQIHAQRTTLYPSGRTALRKSGWGESTGVSGQGSNHRDTETRRIAPLRTATSLQATSQFQRAVRARSCILNSQFRNLKDSWQLPAVDYAGFSH